MQLRKAIVALALVLVLAIAGASAAASARLLSSSSTAVPPNLPDKEAYRTEQALAKAPHPARNLYKLYPALKGVSRESIQRIAGSTKGWKLGTTVRFWISNLQLNVYKQHPATIRYISNSAYWFVENGREYSQSELRSTAEQFDHIATKDRATFGREWSPGVDNDPRIVVLIASTPGAGGYYSSADEYPKSINPFSNEHEMIYIDSQPGDPYFDATLAHEFQHMIHWHQHSNQDVWMNEGMSEYAMELNGYPVDPEAAFTQNPDVQLNTWSKTPDGAVAHYGEAYRFMSYLSNRFGPHFMSRVIKAQGTGLNAIDRAIRETKPGLSLAQVYDDWLVSNYLMRSGHDRFSNQANLSRVEPSSLPLGRKVQGSVNQWGADYYSLDSLKPFTVILKADPKVRLASNNPRNGKFEWYSNRGDLLDSTLTRDIDLSHTSKATLHVNMWYDIEKDFDYAYVEVSTNGGKTWKTLRGEHSTATNPNGNNLGNGYTGQSKGWIDERFDLNPYVGKKIELRFEYITDDGYNAQGLSIDGVSIPEIGWKDDSESVDGWVSKGWVRTGDWVPARYQLLIVDSNGHGSYRMVPIGADGRAVSTFGKSHGRPPVIIVTGTSSTTTRPSNYQIEVRPVQPGLLGITGARAAP